MDLVEENKQEVENQISKESKEIADLEKETITGLENVESSLYGIESETEGLKREKAETEKQIQEAIKDDVNEKIQIGKLIEVKEDEVLRLERQLAAKKRDLQRDKKKLYDVEMEIMKTKRSFAQTLDDIQSKVTSYYSICPVLDKNILIFILIFSPISFSTERRAGEKWEKTRGKAAISANAEINGGDQDSGSPAKSREVCCECNSAAGAKHY